MIDFPVGSWKSLHSERDYEAMPTLLLNKNTVKELLDMSEVIEAVEQAFRDWAEGRGRMPPKSYVLLEKGDFRAMPAALPGIVGIKWVNVHPQNPSRGLPTVMATLVINDPDTGYPLAIMDGTDITAYRTGATAAVASRFLKAHEAWVSSGPGARPTRRLRRT
ncbi:MAG: arcB, partial [Dehalococcoidia bacterium]|nr:arcB [Dehalococcoidia bacterium]